MSKRRTKPQGVRKTLSRTARQTFLFDAGIDTTANTTPYKITLLGNLINSTSILTCSPSLWRPIVNNTTNFGQRAVFRLRKVECRYSVEGSSGTSLTAGDLFNNVRMITFTTMRPTGSAITNPLADILDFPDMQDIHTIVDDRLLGLPTQAFDSSDYNVPMIRTGHWSRKVNLLLDCRTADATGTSGWNTVAGDLYVALVSDSSVSPHPAVKMNWRMTVSVESS